MGSYDGAELCELVGIYILHELSKRYGLEISGLYRDDGLQCNKSARIIDRMKKDIIKLFKEKFSLRIKIETNLKIFNFLDVTLDLNSGTFKPYTKPNSQPLYVHVESNHPPKIIERIPNMIDDHISGISLSSKKIFDRAAPFYKDALQQSGHKEKLVYTSHQPNNTKRKRKRKIMWFNPPYSANVKTNVAKKFIKIVEKKFPKKRRLSKNIQLKLP